MNRRQFLSLSALLAVPALSWAEEPKPIPPSARLLFQDHKAAKLLWADVRVDDAGKATLDAPAVVPGFPKIDPAKQTLVQMKEVDGLVIVGIRDDEDGAKASGWTLVHTGAVYQDHGDHGHWRYKNPPSAWASRIDTKQGNPAHVYVYDRKFFVANDRLNGYTRVDPENCFGPKVGQDAKIDARFLPGGGNHITLAVADDKVGYSAWIDGGGPNKGRVDVTPLNETEIAYTFHLPTGVIHGAAANSGKVFFAPADGICWIQADLEAKAKPADVRIHHIPLGKKDDKPLRTGAFATHGRHVLFTSGGSLMILDAKQDEPKPTVVPLAGGKAKPLTPEIVKTAEGRTLAFIFHDNDKEHAAEDLLEILELDGEGGAKQVKTLKVGRSAVDGHHGHHDIGFDAKGQWAYFTNPGDGTITMLSLKTLEPSFTFQVGGMPTALVVHGAKDAKD